jgi:hypothetical protein
MVSIADTITTAVLRQSIVFMMTHLPFCCRRRGHGRGKGRRKCSTITTESKQEIRCAATVTEARHQNGAQNRRHLHAGRAPSVDPKFRAIIYLQNVCGKEV